MSLDLHMENNTICRSILKTISKLRNQISLSWQLTSMHSKFVGHSTEILRLSKIKGPLSTKSILFKIYSFHSYTASTINFHSNNSNFGIHRLKLNNGEQPYRSTATLLATENLSIIPIVIITASHHLSTQKFLSLYL